jgi:precorrin-3B methylase|tara:strand:+ start:8109 stop:8459 length:351 start_codon:yes stop_codon:yes gene_type:complete
MYYNTNNESGEELIESRSKAKTQDDIILDIFNTWRQSDGLTPSEIEEILIHHHDKNWPLTSIRRSISTLTNSGKLTKTNELRGGKYNKNEHIWRFKPQTRQDLNDTNTPGQRDNRL